MKRTVAFVVYDGFNELETFTTLHIVGRAARVSGDAADLDVALVSSMKQDVPGKERKWAWLSSCSE
jgi:hypothetical protein